MRELLAVAMDAVLEKTGTSLQLTGTQAEKLKAIQTKNKVKSHIPWTEKYFKFLGQIRLPPWQFDENKEYWYRDFVYKHQHFATVKRRPNRWDGEASNPIGLVEYTGEFLQSLYETTQYSNTDRRDDLKKELAASMSWMGNTVWESFDDKYAKYSMKNKAHGKILRDTVGKFCYFSMGRDASDAMVSLDEQLEHEGFICL